MIERERKWLLPDHITIGAQPDEEKWITQHYVMQPAKCDQDFVELRTRKTIRKHKPDAERRLTVKVGTPPNRMEISTTIEKGEYQAIRDASSRTIHKIRSVYEAPANAEVVVDWIYELNIRILECEFASAEDCEDFTLPPSMGTEVTDDPRYTNYEMAKRVCHQ